MFIIWFRFSFYRFKTYGIWVINNDQFVILLQRAKILRATVFLKLELNTIITIIRLMLK